MVKAKINTVLKNQDFSDSKKFNDMLSGETLIKRYSILNYDVPCHIGDNIYKENFCFFFYADGWKISTFYCEIIGKGKELEDAKINVHEYDCNDINRADCWEWVDVN